MGYQQGQRIGKAGTGLAEPLPLLLKQASRCWQSAVQARACAECWGRGCRSAAAAA